MCQWYWKTSMSAMFSKTSKYASYKHSGLHGIHDNYYYTRRNKHFRAGCLLEARHTIVQRVSLAYANRIHFDKSTTINFNQK